jgi:hypothetical protein
MTPSVDIIPGTDTFPSMPMLAQVLASEGFGEIGTVSDRPLLEQPHAVATLRDGANSTHITALYSEIDDDDPEPYFSEALETLPESEAKRLLDASERVRKCINVDLGHFADARRVEVFRAFVVALARAVNGWVLILEPGYFTFGVGAYSPDEFANVELGP